MIRYIPVSLIIVVTLLPFSFCAAQNSVSGQITGLSSDKLQLILEEDINRRQSRQIAEIPVDRNGRFHYKGSLSPNIYSLWFNDSVRLMLAIDKDQQVVIRGSGHEVNKWRISGSEDTEALLGYEAFRSASLHRLVNSVRKKIKALQEKGVPDNDSTMAALVSLEVSNYNLHRDELIGYVRANMGTSLAVYPTSLRWSGEKNLDFLSRLAKDFQTAHPGTDIAKKITEKVSVLVSTSIGGRVAEVKLPDKDGNSVSLPSLKAKYILIDFWAGWCAPCRRESPLLNSLYQRYKSAGFEIYSVGMDAKKEQWLRAIEKDKRVWINVTDFKGFESSVAFDFGVTSLPSNFLVDENYQVIAKDLHGDELEKLLRQLFR